MGGKMPAAANVHLHPGWFADTVPRFLAAHPGPVRLVNIDSDIYSSAQTVLTQLALRLVTGTILVFDEFIGNRTWEHDEYRAFMEFITANPRPFHVIAVNPACKQVAIQLK